MLPVIITGQSHLYVMNQVTKVRATSISINIRNVLPDYQTAFNFIYGNNAYREEDNTRVYDRSLKIY